MTLEHNPFNPSRALPQESYAGEEPGPSDVLPPRSSPPPPPALAGAAFHGMAGLDTAPIDPTARRISQALDVTPEGVSRVEIRGLFHRHVSKERIDLALEQLLSLGLINRGTTAGRGRSATLWAKVQNPETDTNTPEPDPYGA
jgi:hypothetical protein